MLSSGLFGTNTNASAEYVEQNKTMIAYEVKDNAPVELNIEARERFNQTKNLEEIVSIMEFVDETNYYSYLDYEFKIDFLNQRVTELFKEEILNGNIPSEEISEIYRLFKKTMEPDHYSYSLYEFEKVLSDIVYQVVEYDKPKLLANLNKVLLDSEESFSQMTFMKLIEYPAAGIVQYSKTMNSYEDLEGLIDSLEGIEKMPLGGTPLGTGSLHAESALEGTFTLLNYYKRKENGSGLVKSADRLKFFVDGNLRVDNLRKELLEVGNNKELGLFEYFDKGEVSADKEWTIKWSTNMSEASLNDEIFAFSNGFPVPLEINLENEELKIKAKEGFPSGQTNIYLTDGIKSNKEKQINKPINLIFTVK